MVGVSQRVARSILKRLDREMGGRLFLPDVGTVRLYRFLPAALRRHRPEYFEDIHSVTERIEALDERVSEVARHLRMLGSTVASHSAELGQLQARRRGFAA